jgi:RND family efflux transporter MFP subunit
MTCLHSFCARLGLLIGLVALAGCGGGQHAQQSSSPTPQVKVSKVLQRDRLEDYEYYTGRTRPIESVEVKPRVTGYLEKILFEAGAEVKKGQVLFHIDDRTYKADYDRATADVTRIQATLERYNADLDRARRMRLGDAISREEYDKASASKAETAAQLAAAKATVEHAKLFLNFTKVLSPIDGVISKYDVTVGNLVTQDQTTLTNIVSVAPIWAYFDVDERTVLRVMDLIRQKKVKSHRDAKVPVSLATETEKGFPHKGIIDFVDNKLDAGTGTLSVRGIFANEDRVLAPNLFVRVRVAIGEPHSGLLVADSAVVTDQGRKLLYVVDDQGEVQARPVRLGALADGLRVIESGVEAGERVIVSGLQRVQPGIKVEVKEVPMPLPAPEPGAAKPAGKK